MGTSIALGIGSELVCDGIEVENAKQDHGVLFPSDLSKIYLSWEIETDELDWWSQSSDVSCELSVTGTSWNGTSLETRSRTIEGSVESWSPGVGVSFIAMLALIIASIGLLRLVGQNDKFRLAAIYTGVIALGFAFHLMDIVSSTWGGPAILLIAALWVWIMTWRSSMEFQLIHEDYQRARKGISTMYSDHFDVLSNSKRQLSIILAMPVLGMIGVIIGFPPQINPNSTNMISLIGYLVIVVGGVVFLIWNANRMYGSLYGRLTEVELQASRIERDLGDPARLLTELASDGLDISAIISQPKPNVAASGSASFADVVNWDEDVSALTDDITEELDDTDSEMETTDYGSVVDIDIEDLFSEESEEVNDDGR
jgi:hypothetical protein